MASITGHRDPNATAEVDATTLAYHVSPWPAWNNPRTYRYSFSATTLSHAVTSWAFAFRNSDPQFAKVIREMRFQITDNAAGNPAAAIEYGMDLYVIRRWTVVSAPGTLGTAPSMVSRFYERMPLSTSAVQQSATMLGWDIRPPANSSSTTVIPAVDQFEVDANIFMGTRNWHLIQAAATPKTITEMRYDAKDLGMYPLVLATNEGIGLRPAVSTWAAIALTGEIEWEEVPFRELDNEQWR